MAFDPVLYANEELVPLLQVLCQLADEEEAADQRRFFASVLSGLECASEAEDLADPFMQLSMAAFLGFELSPATALLLDRLLEKAKRLTEALSLTPSEIH